MMIPAIDLIEGQVVRLFQGDYKQKTAYQYDPMERMNTYANAGASILHVVDLDGAKDADRRQLTVIKRLVDDKQLRIQAGGGVRSERDVEDLLTIGVDRVVIGSLAIKQPELVGEWLTRYGAEKLVLALDVNIDQQGNKWLPTEGWINQSGVELDSIMAIYQHYKVKHVLCTDIAKDGTLTGSNVELYQSLTALYPNICWQASGGIGSLADIATLKPTKVGGVILGKSLLEQKFTLQEAMQCWQNA